LTGEEEIEDAVRRIRLEGQNLAREQPNTIGPISVF
jgi:hypothetical protein